MNTKNAFGFLALGMLMYVTPVFAQSLAVHPEAILEASVRAIWLELMGWVIGGIGSAFILKEAAVRLPALLMMLTPARLLRPVEGQGESVRLPVGVRVSVSS
jgi:hypothetical protein